MEVLSFLYTAYTRRTSDDLERSTIQKAVSRVRLQKFWDGERPETSNVRVKCLCRKSWLT